MTVNELESILHTLKNKDLKVCMNSCYIQEVNGFFYGMHEGESVLMLTNNNVQPRVIPES